MGELRYEFESKPGDGGTLPLIDGVDWLRMPLPMSLNHINLWLLRDAGGWVIVDTGLGTNTTRGMWQRVFADAMEGDPATHVVVTHMHPDHSGCAGFLVETFNVDLWMTREEYLLCRVLISDTGKEAPREGERFYRAAGFSEAQIASYKANFGGFGRAVQGMPQSYRRMQDGERLKFAGFEWEVIVGRGHSPEHACLYDRERNVLISGDQILPTISPNIGVWPTEPLANPLADFFASIDRLEQELADDVLVLPSHGKPFRGAHARLAALRREHTERLDILVENGSRPRRVVDVFDDLFGRAITDGNRIMATGEALAHLHYLVASGEMTVEQDDAQVSWFRNA
jgi:glyoxylase-like metal-dependent hydrolase (beta-lactamase superfamily II)